MHLDSDDLLSRIRRDFPVEFELSQLRQLADVQAAEIDRLSALVPPTSSSFSGLAPRPYVLGDDQDSHHG